MSPTPPSTNAAPPRPRERLADRKLAERHAARARIAARQIVPPSAEQRSFDAFGRGLRSSRLKLIAAAVALVGSAAMHASVYGVGAWVGEERDPERERQIVAEMRRREPERKPEPPPPPPPPPPEKVAVKKPEPRKTDAPPPPPDKKTPPPAQKPRRIVGITLDSTSATGGDGPAFNVGNTREGETATRAADPRKVDREPPPPPAGTNQKASRIPTGGAKYVLPKRKRPAKPPYPEVLRTQGIEASVTVLVTLDATGKVTSVKIIKSGGFPEFDEAARKTALAEQFEPAMRDGNPIPYTLSYTYRFTLEQ